MSLFVLFSFIVTLSSSSFHLLPHTISMYQLYPLCSPSHQLTCISVTVTKSFDDIETWRNEFLVQSRIFFFSNIYLPFFFLPHISLPFSPSLPTSLILADIDDPDSFPFVLLGNKVDQENERAVSTIIYYATSSYLHFILFTLYDLCVYYICRYKLKMLETGVNCMVTSPVSRKDMRSERGGGRREGFNSDVLLELE